MELSHDTAVFVVAVIEAVPEVDDDDFVLLFIIFFLILREIFFGNIFLVKKNNI